MHVFPIVERELSVASRLSATFRNRMFTPLVVAALGVGRVYLFSTSASPALSGPAMFRTLSLLTVLFCAFEGVRKTADCISQEKREGTLGLLFLTDLKSYDVVLGKLFATSLSSFYGLLAMLPILCWSLFLGGVTPGEVFRVTIAAVSILSFSLASGIWVSARSESSSHAMAGTLSLVLGFMVLPPLTHVSFLAVMSPLAPFLDAPDTAYRLHAVAFWISLPLSFVYSWFLLAGAAHQVALFRDFETKSQLPAEESAQQIAALPRRIKLRAKLLEINPIVWLADRSRVPAFLPWVLTLVAAVGACWGIAEIFRYKASHPAIPAAVLTLINASAAICVLGMNIAMKILLASQSCRCMAEARSSTMLELLLCAPLEVEQILQGQILALRRTFLAPALTLLAFELALVAALFYLNSGPMARPDQQREFINTLVFLEAAVITFFVIDFQAVAWAGMWFGLCSRKESQATFKTVLIVMLLPNISFILSWLGVFLFFGWPMVSLVWARLKLQEQFRRLAGNRLSSSGELTGWVPFEMPDISERKKPQMLMAPSGNGV